MAKRNLSYKESGVDIEANAVWVDRIKRAMRSTYGPRVISRHNAFAGMFRLDFDERILKKNYRGPVLVGCADGVGTKVLIGLAANDLSTIGIDLVAMNVNDMITCGAEPLFFLDYLAVSKLEPEKLVELMEGIAEGCRMAGCALLGGETAEMPDLYKPGDLDLAGFAVGVVEHPRIIDPDRVEPGDVIIGLPSSGVHSNGYSLVRKVVDANRLSLKKEYDELGETLAASLIRPTRIYVRSVLAVLASYRVKRVVSGMAHITGGGLAENVARTLPSGCKAVINAKSWTAPPIFGFLERHGVANEEMYRVFNMGIGFVLIVRPTFAQGVCRILKRHGEDPIVIGKVRRGKQNVEIKQ